MMKKKGPKGSPKCLGCGHDPHEATCPWHEIHDHSSNLLRVRYCPCLTRTPTKKD